MILCWGWDGGVVADKNVTLGFDMDGWVDGIFTKQGSERGRAGFGRAYIWMKRNILVLSIQSEILLRWISESTCIYEVAYSGLEFREEVGVGPKYWVLHRSLVNFILLNLLEPKTSKECVGSRGRKASCEKLGASREQKDLVKTF